MDPIPSTPTGEPTPSGTPVRIWLGVAVVVIIVIAAVFGYIYKRGNGPLTNDQTSKSTEVKQKDVSFEALPDQFPPELIALEKSTKLLQNYNVTKPGAPFQATRVYETNQSLADVLKAYKDFFIKNEWNVKQISTSPNLYTIVADNEKLRVTVNISENSATKVHTVEVTALSLAK